MLSETKKWCFSW